MEVLQNIEWMTVAVSFVLSFALGWLWYSPMMFLKGWVAGIGETAWKPPMWMPMSAQAGSIFLFAIIANAAAQDGHLIHAVLVGITIAGFVKAGALFSGKTIYAVSVEAGYVLAVTFIMVMINTWM